jgi:hypothetical protein
LGWQSRFKFWAWGNGISITDGDITKFLAVDEFGLVKHQGRSFFLPAFSEINIEDDSNFLTEKRFIHMESDLNFELWSKKFIAAYGDKGRIGICFFIASLFSDLVYQKTNFMPLLFAYGPPRMGKSSFMVSLMSLFGIPSDPIMIEGDTTDKALLRSFAQFKNGIVMLDEYKNSIKPKLIGVLKGLYNRSGYKRAKMSNDAQTQTSPILSACVLGGQDMPTADPALFSRTIFLNFDGSNFAPEAFTELQSIERSGLSHIVEEVLTIRELMEQSFNDTYDEVYSYMKYYRQGFKGLDERSIRNVAVLITMGLLAKTKFALPINPCLKADEQGNVTPYDESFWAMMEANTLAQQTLMQHSNDVQEFWSCVDYLVQTGQVIEGVDFQIKESENTLKLFMNKVHPLYVETMRKQGKQYLSSKDSLVQYIRVAGHLAEEKDKLRVGKTVSVGVVCHYDKIGVSLKKINAMEEDRAFI